MNRVLADRIMVAPFHDITNPHPESRMGLFRGLRDELADGHSIASI